MEHSSRPRILTVSIDGSVGGNPGPGAIGVVIEDEHGNRVDAWGEAVGQVTNNQAEYLALLAALRKAHTLGATGVKVRSDSQLLVRQYLGEYRVRDPKLATLHHEAHRLAKEFLAFEIQHVRRGDNREADRLANQARLGKELR